MIGSKNASKRNVKYHRDKDHLLTWTVCHDSSVHVDNEDGNVETRMIEKLLKNTELSLRDDIHWLYEESDTPSHYITYDTCVALKLGIDLSLYEKEFIKELIPTNQPGIKKFAKILNIYSNCIKFMCCAANNNQSTLVVTANWYFVSYKAIDFISIWLVNDNGESSTTHASKQEDNFLELLSLAKSLFRTECNPYPTNQCGNLLFHNQHWNWGQDFINNSTCTLDLDSDDHHYNIKYNRPTDTTILRCPKFLSEFYNKVRPLFMDGINNLDVSYKVNDSNEKLNKKLTRRILKLKRNALDKYPMHPSCAMVSRFGINECAKNFKKYVLYLGGCCQGMIRGLNLRNDSKATVTEVLKRVMYDDIQSLQNLNIANIYLTANSSRKLLRDIEFYALLHFEILKAGQSKQKKKKNTSSLISIDKFAEEKSLYTAMEKILNDSGNRFEDNKLYVTREDFLHLKDGEWLNDVIINAFGKLLNDHCDDKIFFFGTHFKDLQKQQAENFLNKHHLTNIHTNLVFPINENHHWFTLVVQASKRLLCTYDSLQNEPSASTTKSIDGVPETKIIKLISEYFNIPKDGWKHDLKQCPQQPNSNDCGIHTCMHMYALGMKSKLEYNSKCMKGLRAYVFHCITEEKIIIP